MYFVYAILHHIYDPSVSLIFHISISFFNFILVLVRTIISDTCKPAETILRSSIYCKYLGTVVTLCERAFEVPAQYAIDRYGSCAIDAAIPRSQMQRTHTGVHNCCSLKHCRLFFFGATGKSQSSSFRFLYRKNRKNNRKWKTISGCF